MRTCDSSAASIGVPRAELAERIRYAVEMAGLGGREHALVATLAGGWQQRLALGCAILHRPPILFLDEPTSGVEPASRRRFWDLIHALAADGVTVLVSTHYMDEAEYCHRVALINQGRLIATGSPEELKRTALGGELLLVECDALGPTLAALQQAPGVRDCSVFGNALHVLVANAEAERDGTRHLSRSEGTGAEPHRTHRAEPRGCFRAAHCSRCRQPEIGGMRLRRLRAIAVKELLQIWRDPRSLLIALLMPFTQMLLLGYGISLDLKHLPVCTFDREGSQNSQALLKQFQASQLLRHRRQCADISEARPMRIDRGRLQAGRSSSRRISRNGSNDVGSASVQAIRRRAPTTIPPMSPTATRWRSSTASRTRCNSTGRHGKARNCIRFSR